MDIKCFLRSAHVGKDESIVEGGIGGIRKVCIGSSQKLLKKMF